VAESGARMSNTYRGYISERLDVWAIKNGRLDRDLRVDIWEMVGEGVGDVEDDARAQ